ncbi:MAG TPA: ROK family protein, partial [Nevskiaceae bacterium]
MRIGIDLGGTKIAGVVLAEDGTELAARRVATPRGDYAATVQAVAELVATLEGCVDRRELPVGVGHPGTIAIDGLVMNANSTCLNGRPLAHDLATALHRAVKLANDANCLAVSELRGGAAAGATPGFAVILGTGVGGALAVGGDVVDGARGGAGEWGHNPLPWPRAEWGEVGGPACWCGQAGCIETWLSGVGLAADHARRTGIAASGEEIVRRAQARDAAALVTLARYEDRLARALAAVINLLDPQVVVLGGGLSRIARLYEDVPRLWGRWVFGGHVAT